MKNKTAGTTEKRQALTLIQNWVSLVGVAMATIGFVGGIGLIVLDVLNPFSSPYAGILTYLVVPVILVVGLLLILVGVLRERRHRRLKGTSSLPKMPVINLNDQRQFLIFISVIVITFLFFTLSGVGSYRAYHFTESVEFCGLTCHSVMKPEYTTYQHSPHANVPCTKCHIGPGADFFVKSKLNGLYQVYSTIFDKFDRPIGAPVHNLRPAKETCYTCHWPAKFYGAIQRSRTHFSADEENTPWTINMLVNVGGGDPEHGTVEGIHWHMANKNRIDYAALDEQRQIIPWVRQLDDKGNETVYILDDKDGDVEFSEDMLPSMEIRRMDCIDCHNRPTHRFHSPNLALDIAMLQGTVDPSLPWVKLLAAEALVDEYETEEEALAAIDESLRSEYSDGGENVERTIREVKKIYSENFFPEMKASWKDYPDNIGHLISAGCFRCHDGKHVSSSGKRITSDCNACHTITAQGRDASLETISVAGLEFIHPGDDDLMEDGALCSDCHAGAPE